MEQALSPQMIIFRVTTGRSWLSTPDANTGTALSRPIAFNNGPMEQSFLASIRPVRDEEEEGSSSDGSQLNEKKKETPSQ